MAGDAAVSELDVKHTVAHAERRGAGEFGHQLALDGQRFAPRGVRVGTVVVHPFRRARCVRPLQGACRPHRYHARNNHSRLWIIRLGRIG